MAEAATKAQRLVSIHPTRMHLSEYKRQEWVCNSELGTTIEDIQRPDYWSHMAALMNQYDHIEVRVDDGAWVAYLLVTSCERNWAKVKLLEKYDLVDDMSAPVISIKHRVEHKGPHLKWCVIRVSDGERVQSELGSKEAANEWLRNHEKAI